MRPRGVDSTKLGNQRDNMVTIVTMVSGNFIATVFINGYQVSSTYQYSLLTNKMITKLKHDYHGYKVNMTLTPSQA